MVAACLVPVMSIAGWPGHSDLARVLGSLGQLSQWADTGFWRDGAGGGVFDSGLQTSVPGRTLFSWDDPAFLAFWGSACSFPFHWRAHLCLCGIWEAGLVEGMWAFQPDHFSLLQPLRV